VDLPRLLLRAADDPTPGITKYGILRFDFTEKPAAAAYRAFISAHTPGDASGDGQVTVSDVFFALASFLFAGGPTPAGDGDANGDGAVDVADIFYLINFLFAGGPAPI